MFDKYDDALISQAYINGYDDYSHLGYDCPCPYDPNSKEYGYWYMGFNDAVQDSIGNFRDEH